MEKNGNEGTCDMYGGQQRCMQRFGGGGKQRGGDHLEDLDVDGRMILKRNFKKYYGTGAEWTEVAQEKDMWRDLVKVEMNLRAPYNVSNFWTSWKTVSFSMTMFHGDILIIKANKMHNFSNLFHKALYMFRTVPLSIIRSISTLYPRNRYLSC